MPRESFGPDFEFLPRAQLLSFEEITRLARLFAAEGVNKLRVTGGEPLLRRELPLLVGMLVAIDGIDDLALTTNGSLLAARAGQLADAGLSRVTVSLDALDDQTFSAMNDVRFGVERVLAGIQAAADAGLGPVKVNMVVKRGVNEHSVLPMAEYFREQGHILRFIEFMDVGNSNHWSRSEVVPSTEIRDLVGARWRYRYLDGQGEIGLISSVTQPFCGACSRARLSADGKLYTCLFADAGYDLRGPMRSGADDSELSRQIQRIWTSRGDRYSELRAPGGSVQPKVEMSYIGG
jgi:cyclic pyranopterin phosphate synthase